LYIAISEQDNPGTVQGRHIHAPNPQPLFAKINQDRWGGRSDAPVESPPGKFRVSHCPFKYNAGIIPKRFEKMEIHTTVIGEPERSTGACR
jgi:hypothetical protein